MEVAFVFPTVSPVVGFLEASCSVSGLIFVGAIIGIAIGGLLEVNVCNGWFGRIF